MSSSHPRSAVLVRVDRVCMSFERALQAGERPAPAEYLGELPEEEQQVLLHELLLIEWEWRRRRGEPCELEDYLKQFPSLAKTVQEAYGQFSQGSIAVTN